MISQLIGKIAHIDPKYLVLDVHGVGYKVFTTGEVLSQLSKKDQKKVASSTDSNSETTLWTYLAVREGALDLYGFPTLAELNFFELLISVSGIGPKTALGILNVASVRTLETAISTGDTSHLTKVSGIGKKNAEKIVLELKDKIDGVSLTDSHGSSLHKATMRGDADVLEALKALGYRESESRDALKKLDKAITDTGMKVKAALKLLNS